MLLPNEMEDILAKMVGNTLTLEKTEGELFAFNLGALAMLMIYTEEIEGVGMKQEEQDMVLRKLVDMYGVLTNPIVNRSNLLHARDLN